MKVRVLRAAALALVSLASVTPARAEPLRVFVRGSARIEARVSYEEGRLVVAGTMVDDGGQPLVREGVRVELQRGVALSATDLAGRVEPCAGVRAAPARIEADGRIALATDDLGTFCLRVRSEALRTDVHLDADATMLHDAAKADLVYDGALHAVSIDFETRPHRISLDGSTASVEVAAHFEGRGGTVAAPGLPLVLTDERGQVLAEAITASLGRATLSFETSRLAEPGPGELRVKFEGSATASPAQLVADVEREAKISLDVPAAKDGKITAADPEIGVALAIDVTSVRGPVDGGVVQALVGQSVVGAAPVRAGHAALVATFGVPRATQVDIRLHYAPDAPWHLSGRDRIVTLPVKHASSWHNGPLLALGAALLAWTVLGRTQRKRELVAAKRSLPPPPPPPHAEVEVVRRARGHEGWSGVVRDAHDGAPIPGAEVRLERPGFTGQEALGESKADEAGAFVLPPREVRPGDELVVRAPLHATLRRAVPADGEIRVSLVLRRRALLDRLVRWARRRGMAAKGDKGEGRREPTPAEVRAGTDDPRVVAWAEAVERAAFGGGIVDASAEERVDALAPGDGGRESAPPSARPRR